MDTLHKGDNDDNDDDNNNYHNNNNYYYYDHHHYHLHAGYLQLYTCKTHVSSVRSIAAVLYLQFVLDVMLYRP
jgi:hypothetical protein